MRRFIFRLALSGKLTFSMCLLISLMAVASMHAWTQATVEDGDAVEFVDAFPGQTFALPSAIAHAGDERLFVVEQAGLIRVLSEQGPGATNQVFLDISERVTAGGEMGLLGLAFHPDYQNNGYFFVNYTRAKPGGQESVIARYVVTADANAADPDSELILLTVDQPHTNHNGGALHFGPDGMLYIGLGDGGSAGDPDNYAQNGQELLGKMLRIDVDDPAPGKNYGIPEDNPFIGQPARDEIWALGLRNPWRFSFDRLTGDLYMGDVGQGLWEEIDFQPAGSAGGENYGWRLKEGTHCYNPAEACDPGGLTDPVYEYSHDQGCSITGGTVYRGRQIPALQGRYLYADYCTGLVSALYRDGQGVWHNRELGAAGGNVTTFGEDGTGEVYLALRNQGKVLKLASSPQIFLPAVRG